MSGVYNLTDYYEYEVERAIEHVSFMVKANGLDTLIKHSPSYYANLMAISHTFVVEAAVGLVSSSLKQQ